MKKFATLSAVLALMSTQAAADVRPADCRPVFPVVDEVTAVVPTDVITAPAEPVPVAERSFVGLPFLFGLIGIVGFIVIITHHSHHNKPVSPA